MSPSRPQCELQSERLIRALSLGRGDGRWTSKRRPCITGTEFRVWHDPGAARRGGWQSSPVRPYCGRPGAPRCFTKFQSGGKAIMSDPLHAYRISKEKLGHTLELRFARQTGQTTAEGFIIVPHRITAPRLPRPGVIPNSTEALSTGGTPRTHTRSRDSSSR